MKTLALALVALASTAAVAKPKPEPRAIVFAIDRSGSMAGKLDATLAAVHDAMAHLAPNDQVALVVFDSGAQLAFDLRPAADRDALFERLGRIEVKGGTNYVPALALAKSTLAKSRLSRKQVVLLSDGPSPSTNLASAVAQLRATHATLSTIAIPAADTRQLAQLAASGRGRTVVVTDLTELQTALLAALD